ncbi:hypothetical protein Bbelb_169070 [Branchiostoma belcheri]|nr:hypothetical protein Bbelb_169070 [Branchiostoma belcheri]
MQPSSLQQANSHATPVSQAQTRGKSIKHIFLRRSDANSCSQLQLTRISMVHSLMITSPPGMDQVKAEVYQTGQDSLRTWGLVIVHGSMVCSSGSDTDHPTLSRSSVTGGDNLRRRLHMAEISLKTDKGAERPFPSSSLTTTSSNSQGF